MKLMFLTILLVSCTTPSHVPEGTAPQGDPWLLNFCNNPANRMFRQCIDMCEEYHCKEE